VSDRDEIRERRRLLKEAYGELYHDVAKIFFDHDPMGINLTTNTDEYEPEVDTLLPV
jgi:hypothetical protein